MSTLWNESDAGLNRRGFLRKLVTTAAAGLGVVALASTASAEESQRLAPTCCRSSCRSCPAGQRAYTCSGCPSGTFCICSSSSSNCFGTFCP